MFCSDLDCYYSIRLELIKRAQGRGPSDQKAHNYIHAAMPSRVLYGPQNHRPSARKSSTYITCVIVTHKKGF